MIDDTKLSSRVSAAICALLFSSIMVLSAVGPARASASEPALASDTAGHLPTQPAAYLA
jgi:hypothetical protein